MKSFKDLIIKGSREELKSILREIIAHLPKGWSFKSDSAAEYSRNVSKGKDEVGCFQSPKISDRIALVWMVLWESELKVVNIVPVGGHSLSHDEYNAVLDRFYDECVQDIATEKAVEINLTEGTYDVEKIAGKKTFEALNKWERACNQATGNTHPSDFGRWADFVCISFQERSQLTPDLFERWLTEERSWTDDELTTKLVLDYEYGLSILERYVENC